MDGIVQSLQEKQAWVALNFFRFFFLVKNESADRGLSTEYKYMAEGIKMDTSFFKDMNNHEMSFESVYRWEMVVWNP